MSTAAAFAFDPSQKRGDERRDEMQVSAMTEDDDGEMNYRRCAEASSKEVGP
jgi:hypothetical protein